jgi:DNA-directed RNA polymerase specialized sigma24 family protein
VAVRHGDPVLRDEGNRRRIRDAHTAEIGGGPAPSPEAQAVGHDLLRQALRQVGDRTAEIALLTHVQGLSVERAAEICGVSERTVARERRAFEAALAGLAEEGESHG